MGMSSAAAAGAAAGAVAGCAAWAAMALPVTVNEASVIKSDAAVFFIRFIVGLLTA
jgi:hypothetical protein